MSETVTVPAAPEVAPVPAVPAQLDPATTTIGDLEHPPQEGAVSSNEPSPPVEGAPPEETEEQTRKRRSVGDRIRQLTAEKHAKDRENRALIERVRSLSQPLVTPEQRQNLDPEVEQHLSMREAVRAERAEEMKQDVDRQLGEMRELRRAQLDAKLENVHERMPDFDAVFHNGLHITDEVAEFIADSARAPEIAYYLGHLERNHPGSLEALANMPAQRRGSELARIEARLQAAPTVRKATTAPPPVRTLAGATSSAADPAAMSQKQYEAWRARK